MHEAYIITNLITGAQYVGITSRNHEVRFREHIQEANRGSQVKLHQAIRTYGAENFRVDVLASNIPDEGAAEAERYFIELYATHYDAGGYNMTIGGPGTIGYHFTEEAKAKISEASKHQVMTPQRNEKIRQAMLGREYKPEWKAALSQSRLGRFTKEENPFFNKHHTEKTKAAIRENNTKHHVLCIDKDTGSVLHEFYNAQAAADWVTNQIGSGVATTRMVRIHEVCRSHNLACTAYGYRWRYKEKSID